MFDKSLAEGIVAHKRGIQSENRPALNPNLLRIIHCIFRGSEIGGSIVFLRRKHARTAPEEKSHGQAG